MRKHTRRLKKKWKITGLLLIALIVFLIMSKSLNSHQTVSQKKDNEIELTDNSAGSPNNLEASENDSSLNTDSSGNKQNNKEVDNEILDNQSGKIDAETSEIDIHTAPSESPETIEKPEVIPIASSTNKPGQTPETTAVPENIPVTTPTGDSDPVATPAVSPESEPITPSTMMPEPSSEPVSTAIPESESHENDGEIDP